MATMKPGIFCPEESRAKVEFIVPWTPNEIDRTGDVALRYIWKNHDYMRKATHQLLLHYDTETTSLKSIGDVIAIGCTMQVMYEREIDNRIDIKTLGHFHTYVYTPRPVPQDSFEVHGISNEILERNGLSKKSKKQPIRAPDMKTAIARLMEWVKWVKLVPEDIHVKKTIKGKTFDVLSVQEDTVYLSGHNIIGYDNVMMASNLPRYGLNFKTLMFKMRVNGVLDTLKLARAWKIYLSDYEFPRYSNCNENPQTTGTDYCWRLEKWYLQWTGRPVTNAHDALYDCRMLSELFQCDVFKKYFTINRMSKVLWTVDKAYKRSLEGLSIQEENMLWHIDGDAHIPYVQRKFDLDASVIVKGVCVNCASIVDKAMKHKCEFPKGYVEPDEDMD